MARVCNNRLSGFLFASTQWSGLTVRLRMEFFLQTIADLCLSLRILGSDRFDLTSEDGSPIIRCEMPLAASSLLPVPRGKRFARPRQIFAAQKLRRSTFETTISKSVFQACSHIAMNVGGRTAISTAGSLENTVAWDRAEDCIHVEFPTSKLTDASSGSTAMFLLITYGNAAMRMNEIANLYGHFDRDDEAAMEALSALALRIFRGDDDVLLTD